MVQNIYLLFSKFNSKNGLLLFFNLGRCLYNKNNSIPLNKVVQYTRVSPILRIIINWPVSLYYCMAAMLVVFYKPVRNLVFFPLILTVLLLKVCNSPAENIY